VNAHVEVDRRALDWKLTTLALPGGVCRSPLSLLQQMTLALFEAIGLPVEH
jgi:hypothetical protein